MFLRQMCLLLLQGLFNFKPSVRPVPLECHIQGFPGKFYCPRMATMNKPAYAAIQVCLALPLCNSPVPHTCQWHSSPSLPGMATRWLLYKAMQQSAGE